MKGFFQLAAIFFSIEFSIAQPGRYERAIFDSITITTDILYGEADFYDANSNHDLDSLLLDFYEPHGDTLSKRPLVITIFGGAFIGGDKDWDDMKGWCDSLSHHGYACASIQYRLLFNLLKTESMIRASYRALQDTRAAIRFFMEYADQYRIDTTNIFLIGNSAGAITALHTAFIAKESERPAATFGSGTASDADDLGCLDCSGNNFSHEVKLAGIIPLWGGVWDISWLEADESLPALLIHGTADSTVPFNRGHAFDLAGFTPFVYGSVPIDSAMNQLFIPHEFHPFDTLGHSFYMDDGGFTFPNEHWEPVFELGRDFLYKVVSSTFTAINGNPPEAETKFFPNPAADAIFLNFSEELSFPLQVSLINMLGVKETSLQLSSETLSIDISNLPRGIYFVAADKRVIGKLVKE